MTVLVTGSRGRVGASLVSLLHAEGHPVRAASRAPEEVTAPPGVPTVACDLGSPATFPAALDGVDSVFLYADPGHIDAFIEQARTAGVRHIVLLSSSSVLDPGAADNRIGAFHLNSERALESAPIEATFLRPGDFATNALQWSRPVRATGAVDLPQPDAYGSPIHERDIADVAFAVLTRPGPGMRGTGHHLTGPEPLTFTQQVAVLARATGRDIKVNTVTPEAWKRSVAAHVPAEIADALLAHWAGAGAAPTVTTDTVERLTGHPARTFADWATDHADAFRT
ncbi:NAD(P)H-binding protein [Streptomyces sp. NPDC091212]|uniref:NAD(P)H-binding protein n=1 Tax=Streptomyces sp. NPDC091212 TaxID=3155191 RepID=UPI00342872A4